MEKLTDRQVELIKNLLLTYQYFCQISEDVKEYEYNAFQFNGEFYQIAETDWSVVCEIIDYIKGVKN